MTHDTFEALVRQATGRAPYPYQQRLADDGLPGLLRAATGTGKTLAATLPWVYRRRFHPDEQVRRQTPRWLVVVLPQRSLVEQTVGVVRGWLDRLGLAGAVAVHVLMGGASTDDRAWKLSPGSDAIFVGTQDMVLSRLLLRGYAEPRAQWPIGFGLLHAGVQYVFDEVQLMGPALPTSLQLEGLRTTLGTAAPVRSMWMSATVDPQQLRTADYDGPREVVELSDADRSGALRGRLEATRLVARGFDKGEAKQHAARVAQLVRDRHTPGTRSIVVVNTVDRAVDVYETLKKAAPAADVVLLHSRFRPADRAELVRRALADPGDAGTIVVATQVLEAGVDVSSRLLVTELAPWSSMVQRAGRCNRAGEYDDARLLWLDVPAARGSAAPYDEADLSASREALTALDGQRVTSTELQDRAVPETRPLHPVLRRRDLVGLFDTSADLSGNDLDVSQWIRDADMTTAAVAWRDISADGPQEDAPFPTRAELCAAPLGQLRERLGKGGWRGWLYDQTTGSWRRASVDDVRPGAVILLPAGQGGYLPDVGWSPSSRAPVPLGAVESAEVVEDVTSDPLSVRQERWVTLAQHLDDVRREAEAVLGEFGPLPGLTDNQRAAAALAGLYHDLGKAHPVFADTLRRSVDGDEPPGGPWAKSPAAKQARHSRRYFRHELVSALLLLEPETGLLDGVGEQDLVAYLVAAHHGKARLTIRAMPGEQEQGSVLGVRDVDEPTAAVTLLDGRQVGPIRARLDLLTLGGDGHLESWQARVCRLRDRADLGPFRLAFLEAVVRMADWRASASYEMPAQEGPS